MEREPHDIDDPVNINGDFEEVLKVLLDDDEDRVPDENEG
jgi:hypothetical protein